MGKMRSMKSFYFNLKFYVLKKGLDSAKVSACVFFIYVTCKSF